MKAAGNKAVTLLEMLMQAQSPSFGHSRRAQFSLLMELLLVVEYRAIGIGLISRVPVLLCSATDSIGSPRGKKWGGEGTVWDQYLRWKLNDALVVDPYLITNLMSPVAYTDTARRSPSVPALAAPTRGLHDRTSNNMPGMPQ